MRQEDNNEILNSEACEEFDSRLMLLAAGELTPDEEADVADHLKHCARCTEALEKERELVECFAASRIEPDAALLASCRSSLEDALDRQEERGWLRRIANVFLPAGGLAPRPAWSAALLVLVGFSVGILGPRFLQRTIPVSGDFGYCDCERHNWFSQFRFAISQQRRERSSDRYAQRTGGRHQRDAFRWRPAASSGIADARTTALPRAGHSQ